MRNLSFFWNALGAGADCLFNKLVPWFCYWHALTKIPHWHLKMQKGRKLERCMPVLKAPKVCWPRCFQCFVTIFNSCTAGMIIEWSVMFWCNQTKWNLPISLYSYLVRELWRREKLHLRKNPEDYFKKS